MRAPLASLLAGALLAPAATGAELTARDVMEKNFFASKVAFLRVESSMVLTNAGGQQRKRGNTTLIRLQPNGVDSKYLIRFGAPADIKGTGVLQVEHVDGEDDLWIYLPALKKSRRLVANNKKDSFAGTDFSYGDISLPKVDRYRHSLLRREAVDGLDCYVVESLPADEAVRSNSGYSKKVSWVRADNFLESKVEYYDLAGRLLKTQRTRRHELVEPDKSRWFALYREMTNHQNGHSTTIDASKVDARPIPDDAFSTRQLEAE